MKNILIAVVYHSEAGHTARQAAAVRRGVDQVAGTTSLFLTSEEAQKQWDALEQADAIVFGTPTYMGSASSQFKAFMEASLNAYLKGAWKDKIAAGFTNSASRSGDKLDTLVQLASSRHSTACIG
jgi:NAD(P)H dehydrogenase (quinone)